VILERFHPAIRRWFTERLGEPTAAQRKGWEAIRAGRDTLIAAPTGSGKTLAAFLSALDELFTEGQNGPLPDETRVVYVSPLKALSSDIHVNLAEPRREIRQLAEAMGYQPAKITAAVRTGDTPQSERAAMIKTPPHILVTTPESLYLLLTAERGREMLRTVRTVIVDEIHAVIESRRGAHLALSLERLEHVAGRKLQRIGLSATQRPIEDVARFLVGSGEVRSVGPSVRPSVAVIDEGHKRALDLAIELPGAPLEAVMSNEVWEEIYDRIATLANEHKTTLVFVNTRRMCERVAYNLAERLGEDAVAAHHGSLSREKRQDAERRLKQGDLRLLVATASLELGIDIGSVDLVCQLGTTRRIAAFLQRVGRSGHTVRGTPKGRLFPLSRDELVECAALLRAVRAGELDRLRMPPHPLDVLAQQLVAETAAEDWDTAALFDLVRRAWPYHDLDRATFDEVLAMIGDGFSTRRGRRGALIHLDRVNGKARGRKAARLTAITSGGAIPDLGDFRVILEPDETFVGTVNEDWAFESMAGDIFQLGNTCWEILRIEAGTVRVKDAHGQPPTLPFWFGEAPARSDELSQAVGKLITDLAPRLNDPEAAVQWLVREFEDDSVRRSVGPSVRCLSEAGAEQIVRYLGEAQRMLGALPSQDTLVMERFFDEAGGMQLIIHSPFGSRINRAWGLALRKRFCRQFNFELQAAATENALLLSLGPQHSFPLEDVFRYLHPNTVRDVLVQALLDAPMFGTRWRWNTTLALAVLRNRGGKRSPPQIQRMEAEDLLAAVFPDAAACLENIAGDREVPDHPLVRQTIEDCLDDAMDLPGLIRLLTAIHGGGINLVARDLPEPSPLASEILNARPYAFLDDAPAEERRALAVNTRRAFDPGTSGDLGALDPAAIERVRAEAWPSPDTADELHDALMVAAFLRDDEIAEWAALRDELVAAGRIVRAGALWFAVERKDEPLRELVRGRMEIAGPLTVAALARLLGASVSEADAALHELEREGVVLRGHFTPGVEELEWCERRLLARIHRYTIGKLRAEIEPVTTADFMSFLFDWQHLTGGNRVLGLEGLEKIMRQLDGFEVPAGAWEMDILGARCEEYDPHLLDTLCLMGRVMWGRVSPPTVTAEGPASGPLRSTRIALFLREHRDLWLSLRGGPSGPVLAEHGLQPGANARAVLDVLERRGASFFGDLVTATGLLATHVEQALAELAGIGLVTADGFTGLRALITPEAKRPPLAGGVGAKRRTRTVQFGVESAGRWSLLRRTEGAVDDRGEAIEHLARTLLLRYGVVFRKLLAREPFAVPWRELLRTFWRLEARGEIRGGRFVAGVSGEQFALPEAVGQLRAVRRREKTGELVSISAADPLNLSGVIGPDERVSAVTGNRLVFEDGRLIAVREAGKTRQLVEAAPEKKLEIDRVIVRKRVSPSLRARLGMAG
jgi:ATP-dependent helicase Lhr and Lhr-like helicase